MPPRSAQIREVITSAKPELMRILPDEAVRKPGPEAWSKNEILGHLIDSAANNHQRIVRAALNTALDFPPYQQNGWVEVQHYNEASWFDLVELFVLNNLHLCRVIDGLAPEVMGNPCNIGREAPVTVQFIVDDYLRHLKLHLSQILEPEPIE